MDSKPIIGTDKYLVDGTLVKVGTGRLKNGTWLVTVYPHDASLKMRELPCEALFNAPPVSFDVPLPTEITNDLRQMTHYALTAPADAPIVLTPPDPFVGRWEEETELLAAEFMIYNTNFLQQAWVDPDCGNEEFYQIWVQMTQTPRRTIQMANQLITDNPQPLPEDVCPICVGSGFDTQEDDLFSYQRGRSHERGYAGKCLYCDGTGRKK